MEILKYAMLHKLFLKLQYFFQRKLLKITLKNEKDPFERTLNGNRFYIQNKWSYLSALKEIYIDECYKLTNSIKIQSVLDIGANLGFSVAYFKTQFPECKITAFEADPSIFEYLQKNVSSNQFTGVTLMNGAAWVQDGELEFHQDHSQGGSLQRSELHKNTTKVKTFDLRRIINTSGPWDLLKIDVEGAETAILTHIQNDLKDFKAIFIEYHEHKGKIGSLSQLLNILEVNGFKYSISPIYGSKNIFNEYVSNEAFDLQLNIHAVKLNLLENY